jgi:hypothetical protein
MNPSDLNKFYIINYTITKLGIHKIRLNVDKILKKNVVLYDIVNI